MADKYNYDTALELLKDAYNANVKVTYKDLENALGLEYPIEDYEHKSINYSVITRLRNILKEKYGLTLKSAASGRHIGPEYQHYTVSKVKSSKHTKKKSVTNKKSVANKNTKSHECTSSSDKDTELLNLLDSFEVLSKNNQKLYNELEDEKAANAVLKNECIKLQQKEHEYRNIIESLYKLSDIAPKSLYESKEEHYHELLNSIINNVSNCKNDSNTIKTLLLWGFTVEDLVQDFNFNESDIKDCFYPK